MSVYFTKLYSSSAMMDKQGVKKTDIEVMNSNLRGVLD